MPSRSTGTTLISSSVSRSTRHFSTRARRTAAKFRRFTSASPKRSKAGRSPRRCGFAMRRSRSLSAHGIAYEKELGYTKRWYPLVRVVGLGEPNGMGWLKCCLGRGQGGPENEPRCRPTSRLRMFSGRIRFRRRFEVGDQFTVCRSPPRVTFGNGKITDAASRGGSNLEQKVPAQPPVARQ